MDGQRKLIDIGLFATQVKDTDLGVGDTTTEAGFGIRLVLAVSVAAMSRVLYESLFPVVLAKKRRSSYRAGRRAIVNCFLWVFFLKSSNLQLALHLASLQRDFLFSEQGLGDHLPLAFKWAAFGPKILTLGSPFGAESAIHPLNQT